MSFNKVTGVGRLGMDPERRFIPNGSGVTKFTVATDVGFGDKKTTQWFTCEVWDRGSFHLSEYVARDCKKGDLIYFEGAMSTDEWKDKEGNIRKSTKVTLDRVEYLNGGSRNNSNRGADPVITEVDPDHIPF
jgi:single-strand DNA-binding protein